MDLIKFSGVLPNLSTLWKSLEAQLCLWCRCRHLGINNISFYKQSQQAALSELKTDYSAIGELVEGGVDNSKNICGGCFGVLTHFTDDNFLAKVEDEVQSQQVEFEHFCCSIALPAASLVRDYTYLLLCADTCPDVYSYLPLEQIPTVKDVWKWMCGAKLERRFGKKFALEHMDILINFTQVQIEGESDRLVEPFRDHFKKRKGQTTDMFTHNRVLKALNSVSREKLRTLITYPPDSLAHLGSVKSIVVSHNPVYVAGRYNKYSRELSQSPWIIDGERKGLNTSVSELLTQPLIDYTRSDAHYFSSSGREDIDVQMLGGGRPFMLQLINPSRVLNQDILTNIQEEINHTNRKLVKVRDLQIVSREATDELKDLEAEKRKTYSALCLSDSAITQEELDKLSLSTDIVLDQMTPIRVLHRRALATRQRTVHWMKAELEPDNDRLFTLTVETQGGTYVKEFVHSDFGRTVPNLGSILSNRQLDIISLDVLSVHVDWPPALITPKEQQPEPT